MAQLKQPGSTALPKILSVRGRRVVVDSELAKPYGVPTKRLNETVRRNATRLPEEFCFLKTAQEFADLRSQIVTSSSEGAHSRSQFATLKKLGRGEHDSVPREVIDRLQPLLDAPEPEEEARPKIGFHPGNR